MSANILEITDLTLNYTTRGRTVRALDAVSLAVGAGTALGVVKAEHVDPRPTSYPPRRTPPLNDSLKNLFPHLS